MVASLKRINKNIRKQKTFEKRVMWMIKQQQLNKVNEQEGTTETGTTTSETL